MAKLKTNFYSSARNASGMYLLSDIYLHGTVDEVIEQLNNYKKQYSEYDYLVLETTAEEGACLVGYINGRVEGN